MEADRLLEVLDAAEHRRTIGPAAARGDITLISRSRTLTVDDAPRVRAFQRAILDELRLTLVVIGGGYECTKVVMKVVEFETDDLDEALRIVRQFLGEPFRRHALNVPFDTLVIPDPYVRRDLRSGTVDSFSPRIEIFAKEVTVGEKSGDTYNTGRAGMVGREVRADTFTQIWNDWAAGGPGPDIAELASQLGLLREQLKLDAQTAEEDVETGAVAQAEVAAKAGDGTGVLAALAGAGKWALGVAEKIGAVVAAAAIRRALGLP